MFSGKVEERQQMIDVREAFNLWDVLKSEYDLKEYCGVCYRFAHDRDFKILISLFLDELQENKITLEKMMELHGVAGPEQGRLPSNWYGNSEALRDEGISTQIMFYIQEHIENLLRCVRTSMTNEKIRNTFVAMLQRTVDISDSVYKYLKLKGWIDTPPIYLNTPAEVNEVISCSTAAHLWDHLTFRYDNIHQTKLLLSYVNDIMLRKIIERGLNKIVHQADTLEVECKRFGITMPKRPSEVIINFQTTNAFLISDDHIYRTILCGLQGASILHADALKECTVNDRIRGIFKKFLLEEVGFYNNFVKLGKAKGWLNPVPLYRVS